VPALLPQVGKTCPYLTPKITEARTKILADKTAMSEPDPVIAAESFSLAETKTQHLFLPTVFT